MREKSIKVTIAGRTYPLTIKPEEEQDVLYAVSQVNNKIKDYEQAYSIKDKQDLLAMCVLHLATTNAQLEKKCSPESSEIAHSLVEMEALVTEALKKTDPFTVTN